MDVVFVLFALALFRYSKSTLGAIVDVLISVYCGSRRCCCCGEMVVGKWVLFVCFGVCVSVYKGMCLFNYLIATRTLLLLLFGCVVNVIVVSLSCCISSERIN